MAKHPKNNDKDDDDEFDSNKHREANKAKIKDELSQGEQQAKETAENQELANFKGLPREGETRDQLLARIRKMRDEPDMKDGAIEVETFRSEGLQKEFEAEQKAGQEAVAKAAKERDQMQAAWAKEAEGGKK